MLLIGNEQVFFQNFPNFSPCIFAGLLQCKLPIFHVFQEQTGFLWPWLVLSWIDTVFTGVGLTVALFTGRGWLVLYLAVDTLAEGFFLYVVHERRKEILDAQR